MYTLLIVFIVLKLTNVVDWSWWLVVLPLFIPYLFMLFMLVWGCVTIVIENVLEIMFNKK